MSLLGRYVRETLVNLSRNALMSVASVTIIAASLILLGTLLIFVANLDHLLARETGKAQVTVFFKPGTDIEVVLKRIREMRRYPEVAEVRYVPKEEIFQRVFKGKSRTPELLKELKFPEAAEIRTHRAEEGKAVAARVTRMPEVLRVNYGAALVDRLLAVKRAVNLGGLGAVLLFALAALLTVSNTIHLTITAREAEISIMQLVGATAWYIKIPFLLEGMAHGLFGALLALGGLVVGYGRVYAYVQERLPFITAVEPGAVTPTLVVLLVGAGVIYGLLGSYLSVRRLLHVG